MIKVPSFEVDHTTLDAGFYLRDKHWLNPFTKLHVWDLRFYAPRDHKYLTANVAHSIEHLFAFFLRKYLGKKYVSISPFGCGTGFCFITKGSVTRNQMRLALIQAIDDILPISCKADIPALTEKTCGNPNRFSINETNAVLSAYRALIYSLVD